VANPIEQFKIKPIIPLEVAGVDVSFTNSAVMMVISVVLITAFLTLSVRSRALVPGRWQSLAEVFYEFIAGMLRDNVARKGGSTSPSSSRCSCSCCSATCWA
jgi:F-type H+-transporting ATPase subunit a